VQGAAWATLIGRTLPLFVAVPLMIRYLGPGSLRLRSFAPKAVELRRLLALAWPSSTHFVVRIGWVLVVIGLINAYFTTSEDQTVLTAYGICMRLETMALFVGMGWGAAASSFMGSNLGAKNVGRALASGWVAAVYNLVFTAGLVALYFVYTNEVIGFFDGSEAVLAVGREYVRWVAPSYCLLAVAVVLSQAMTGAGATLTSMALDSGMLLLLVIPGAVFVTAFLGVPRTALWTIIAAGNGLGALAFIVWYRRGSFISA
jgi:Na+-driven multidrug efflux pump